jgi:putative SOS response-associated peptidase YedK
LPDNEPFYFAGVWESGQKNNIRLETFLILTTAANQIVSHVHNRMPVIVRPEFYDTWLDPDSSVQSLTDVLHQPRNHELKSYSVSPLVNNARNESADCIQPFTAISEALL